MSLSKEEYEREKELVKYFIKSHRIPLTRIARETGVNYGTIAYYSKDLKNIDYANQLIVQGIYSYMLDIGVESKEDIDKIIKKTEYIVNK